MNRTEWLKWRHKGIGSSDAAAIMGVSPWKTPLKLHEEKIQAEPPPENSKNHFILNKGNEIEEKIRAQFEMLQGKSFKDCKVQDSEFEFLRATLDGRSEDKKEFVEIKLLGKDDFALATLKIVPEKYWPQVQHQFMVSGCEKGWFACYLYDAENSREYDSSRMIFFEIKLDKEYCLDLLEKEVKFWDGVVSKKPPLPSARDYKTLKGVSKLVNKWKKLNDKIKLLSNEQAEIRKEILKLAEVDGHPRLAASGVRMYKESRQGAVDNKKIYSDYKIDEKILNSYRKPGSQHWVVETFEEKGTLQ